MGATDRSGIRKIDPAAAGIEGGDRNAEAAASELIDQPAVKSSLHKASDSFSFPSFKQAVSFISRG